MIKFINMSEIYKNYMTLSPDEAYDYIVKKSEEYNYTLNYFYTYLSRYTRDLSIEEQYNYNRKRRMVTFSQKQEVKYITDYINGVSDFKNVLLIGDKRKIIYYLDKYVDYFNDKEDKINEIKNNLDNLIMINSSNLESIKEELDNNMTTMLNILACNTEEEAFKQIKKFNFSKDIYYIYLDHFIDKFPKELEKIKYLKYLADKYYTEETNLKNSPQYMNILRNVLLSGYSIEEYCSNTGVTISTIKKAFRDARNIYQIEVDEIKNIIEQRNNDDFYRMIKLSVYKFLNNKEFDMLDYYDITHLSVEDYLNISRKLIYDQKIMKKITDLLHNKVCKNGRKLTLKEFKYSYLSAKTIIDGNEVNNEIKEKAFDYMEEKNYPVEAYSLVLKKMVNKTL